MARTDVPTGHSLAVKKYSGCLAGDVGRKGYWTRKFMSAGEVPTAPIHQLMELENDAGDKITYDLSMQLKMQPVEGDAKLEGKEEKLQFYTDEVYIDQLRGGVNTGGKMTRKRTLYNLREISRVRQADWWARVFDELFFMYISGARGANTEFIYPIDYTGFAHNPISAPDSEHLIVANGKAKATLLETDKMTLSEIDKAVAYATMMGGGTQGVPQIQPSQIEGSEPKYVCVMNPWQEYDLRTNTSTGQWLDLQKAISAAEGRNTNIYKGGLGEYNNTILHKHANVIRFTDYGSGGNVEAARALFLGIQAGTCAFGSPGTKMRYSWNEETADRGNELVITTSTIVGIKKCTFNGKDFGVMAIDTAAKKP
jgi:N4-gp56 family major capsid protein